MGRELHVLVVEDHADSATAIARLLRAVGHRTQIAATYHRALELARQETFDLVICDISLPDGSGYDLMRHVQGLQKVKGIALSGFSSTTDLGDSQAAGFSAHLSKPIDFTRLRDAIDRICAP